MPNWQIQQQRSDFFNSVRSWFTEHHCYEVQVPLLQDGANIDHGVEVFETKNGQYLITSPEHYLKRLLCAGSSDCFAISPCFRKNESGNRHSPQFTMLEWYRLNWDDTKLANECCSLINALLQTQLNTDRISYRDAFLNTIKLDPFTASTTELARHCSLNNSTIRSEVLDLLMLEIIEPSFNPEHITVLHDYPANQAAQARHDTDQHGNPIARRFEIYHHGMELANGYHECSDASTIRSRMQADNPNNYRLDEAFLSALETQGLPDCAGVALGLDRLFMIYAGIDDIRKISP